LAEVLSLNLNPPCTSSQPRLKLFLPKVRLVFTNPLQSGLAIPKKAQNAL
jgi:hypothetical protein